MNRQDRDRYDYGRYEDYGNDAHYHGARNLTDEFEQHFRRETGNDSDRDRPIRSYHEGSEIEDTYNRQRSANDDYSRRSENLRNDRGSSRNYSGNYNREQDNYWGEESMFRREPEDYQQQRNRGMSSGLADDYGYDNRNTFTGSRDQEQNYRSWNEYRSAHGSDRDYSRGADHPDRYGTEEHNRYSRENRPIRKDRWYDSNERTRYY